MDDGVCGDEDFACDGEAWIAEAFTRLEEGESDLAARRERFGVEIDAPCEAIRPIVGEGADFPVYRLVNCQ